MDPEREQQRDDGVMAASQEQEEAPASEAGEDDEEEEHKPPPCRCSVGGVASEVGGRVDGTRARRLPLPDGTCAGPTAPTCS